MADNVELKATVTSDSSQAKSDMKGFGQTVDDVGGKAKTAGEKLADFWKAQKLNPQEIASKITMVADSVSQLGDVFQAVADNDVDKFQSSMKAVSAGVVAVVGAIAPQFAPIAAILAPIVTKTLEWALGMDDAAEAAKRLNEALDFQIELLDRTAKIRAIEADSPAKRLKIELDALRTLVDAKQEAFDQQVEADKQGWFFGNEEKIKKAGDELLKVRQEFGEKLAELRKQEAEDQEKLDEDAGKRAQKRSEDEQEQRVQEDSEDLSVVSEEEEHEESGDEDSLEQVL